MKWIRSQLPAREQDQQQKPCKYNYAIMVNGQLDQKLYEDQKQAEVEACWLQYNDPNVNVEIAMI